MAAPNIVNVTSILGKTTYLSLANTSATVLVTNAASSNKVLKINSIVVANDDGSSACDVTVSVNSAAAGGGTAYKLAHTISVAAASSLVIVDKASSIYLEEDKSIVVTAGTGGDIDVVCSYEEIDDA